MPNTEPVAASSATGFGVSDGPRNVHVALHGPSETPNATVRATSHVQSGTFTLDGKATHVSAAPLRTGYVSDASRSRVSARARALCAVVWRAVPATPIAERDDAPRTHAIDASRCVRTGTARVAWKRTFRLARNARRRDAVRLAVGVAIARSKRRDDTVTMRGQSAPKPDRGIGALHRWLGDADAFARSALCVDARDSDDLAWTRARAMYQSVTAGSDARAHLDVRAPTSGASRASAVADHEQRALLAFSALAQSERSRERERENQSNRRDARDAKRAAKAERFGRRK